MPYGVADAHCDVLMRIVEEHLPFNRVQASVHGKSLYASYHNLALGNVKTQVFALFVFPRLSNDAQLESVLQQIDAFHQQVAADGQVRLCTTAADIAAAHATGKIAGLLSLEGGGSLHGQLPLLRTMYRLGVRGMGLTWNSANELADGCMEDRGGGLTLSGVAFVREMLSLGMWIDIAHLSDAGVSDIFRMTDRPVMASHANARSVHPHRRNLSDDVIREIIERDGWLGLTFEGSFIAPPGEANMDALLRHLDRVIELGGARHIGFGSDFDGCSTVVPDLYDPTVFPLLAEHIKTRYGEQMVADIMQDNFLRFVGRVLPH